MSFPNNLVPSDLAAVNQILAGIGQSPVTTLDLANPDTVSAYNALQETNREVQSEGWYFNREYQYPMMPDNNGHIPAADNMLMITLSDTPENRGRHVVVRNGRLYDMVAHTDVWPVGESVKFDIVWLYQFIDVPQVAKDYIIAKASVVLSSRVLGDAEVFRLLSVREVTTKQSLIEVDSQMGQYRMYGFGIGNDFYSSYEPYRVVNRY